MSTELLTDETTRKLLEAILTVRDPEAFQTEVSRVMAHFFSEATAWGWRKGLEAFAAELERGMFGAAQHGIPAQECGVNVTDLIMAARGMANDGPGPASPGPERKDAP